MWIAKSELKCSLQESFGRHTSEQWKEFLSHVPALALLQVQLPDIGLCGCIYKHLISITLVLSHNFLPSQMAEFYSLVVWLCFKLPCLRAGCAAKIPLLFIPSFLILYEKTFLLDSKWTGRRSTPHHPSCPGSSVPDLW